ncbi:hypothetical protein SAMN05720606_106244 [Paenibacillus polysaccharolyticus]|uniref:DUF5301 domain-containing protein n=1 Tax=Paenibacillus polysaccharolyticus TaxID=582692 RepID=A0A1G5H6D9_9BACL|nr:DUF5301 domain-containing protein [Paenibacillus polysaccharolyticus]SCY59445.1 hypothetical protein SAMN05720606_106244 [Paenibacillus polysaccharolyticus]
MRQKRKYYILACIIILLATLLWFFTMNSTKSLQEDAWNDVDFNTITSIEIEKGHDQKITLTDKGDIHKIMSSLSALEVKKDSSISKDFNEVYMLMVDVNGGARIGMFLYDNKYIDVYDYEASPKKNSSMKYKITSSFDEKNIHDYFK